MASPFRIKRPLQRIEQRLRGQTDQQRQARESKQQAELNPDTQQPGMLGSMYEDVVDTFSEAIGGEPAENGPRPDISALGSRHARPSAGTHLPTHQPGSYERGGH